MLSDDLARYVGLHYTLGFKFRTQRILLSNFVSFAQPQGDRFVYAARVIEWAVCAPSPEQRRNRLLCVRRFAIAMHAEDQRHEIPAAGALGRGLFRRKLPYIYTQDEIRCLLNAAACLPPENTIRPHTYVMLFGLLAATGMRISEALALQLHDVTEDGLVIRQTKFKKSRLIPLHPTTRSMLEKYLSVRLRAVTPSDGLLIVNTGWPPSYETAATVFRALSHEIGLRGDTNPLRPRIHDLRHSFAVRSLEQCACDPQAVSRHVMALSTYLGHAHITDTYWYLQATPALMAQIANATELLQPGEVP